LISSTVQLAECETGFGPGGGHHGQGDQVWIGKGQSVQLLAEGNALFDG
jgi:hypothetical protein